MNSIRLGHLLPVLFIILTPYFAYADDTYVIHVSVDGLGSSYLQSLINSNQLPTFQRLQSQGAWTNNARNDNDYTITLPNHTTQMTGRPVVGLIGHNWTANVDPDPGQTLHSNKGSYIASIFDVAHDNGLHTTLYTGKSKFSLYDTSYDAAHGALDLTGPDNGRDKIDLYNFAGNASQVAAAFITDSTATPAQFSFLHLPDTDAAGHAYGWGSPEYNTALLNIDTALAQIFTLIDSNPTFHDHTYLIVTTDHGGGGGDPKNHIDITNALNYTIPFYVWGPSVTPGTDLYTLNADTRIDPGTGKIPYANSMQPIRNGDSANLELALLGLGPVPGSTINSLQNLHVSSLPEPASLTLLTLALPTLLLRRRSR